ncbi:MAG TPA: deoxyribonuclease V [Blastocatellia bacterium]|jgi:deoxyribonuclease V|nr:deoxyribonuclease V [Blastocatellia bacterium]
MMEYDRIHSWGLKPSEAIELQKDLRGRVKIQPLDRPVSLVAGCDISFNRFSEVIYAGILVLRLSDFEVVDRATVVTETSFPYVPGLLSFRETPALLQAWEKLSTAPDVVMLDGQGLAHPRRFGIACHFGLLTNTPALGCAKTVLVGKYTEPDGRAGSHSDMVHRGETVGAAVRTKDRVSPVFISPGHLIDLPGAIEVALRCVRGFPEKSKYRIPEPTRLAHLMVNELRRGDG